MTALLGGALTAMTFGELPAAHAAAPRSPAPCRARSRPRRRSTRPSTTERGRAGQEGRAQASTRSGRSRDTLTGCTGSQTGGNPRIPGPIDHGDVLVKGKAVGHQCTTLTASGMTIKIVRIKLVRRGR